MKFGRSLHRFGMGALLALSSGLCPACIAADPPHVEKKQKTLPVLDMKTAQPSQLRPYRMEWGVQDITLSVYVRAEDAGEKMIAIAFAQDEPALQHTEFPPILGDGELAPGSDDELRKMTVPLDTRGFLRLGCQHVSMWVTHEGSMIFRRTNRLPDPNNEGDVAIGVWLFDVTKPVDPTAPTTKMNDGCPPIPAPAEL